MGQIQATKGPVGQSKEVDIQGREEGIDQDQGQDQELEQVLDHHRHLEMILTLLKNYQILEMMNMMT